MRLAAHGQGVSPCLSPSQQGMGGDRLRLVEFTVSERFDLPKENALAYDIFTTLSIVFGLMVAAALWKAQKRAIKRDLIRVLHLAPMATSNSPTYGQSNSSMQDERIMRHRR